MANKNITMSKLGQWLKLYKQHQGTIVISEITQVPTIR